VDKPIADSVRRLEADLTATVQGEIRFDKGTCALYATDASNYRQVPVGVMVPRTIDDVVATVAAVVPTMPLSCRAAAGPAYRARPSMPRWS
jgi:FAD/FMN-containing dehydrogenase